MTAADPGPLPEAEEPRDWVFTFGHGHRGVAVTDRTRVVDPAEPIGRGFSLLDRYVVIRGTYESARARMIELFGVIWCAQYGSRGAAGVSEFDLTELVLTDQDVAR